MKSERSRSRAEPGAVLDHLRVVVGRQRCLCGTAGRHRQPAHEVRDPGIGEAFQLRVLVQEVVDFPGLVADHQVVVPIVDHVGERQEVRDQELVHPPDRLERMQVVLIGVELDMGRLVQQVRRRRVHRLARVREYPRHRVLREPVDLYAGTLLPKRSGDREIPPGVAEADRGRQVEHPLGSIQRAGPRTAYRLWW